MNPFQISSIPSYPSANTATSSSFQNNFSVIQFYLAPNLSHSVFSAQIVDKGAYCSHDWVIDPGATDHMVGSVNLLTTITSTIHVFVQLPNG